MAKLRLSSNVLAYADQNINSNPAKRFTDWSRVIFQDVVNPKENQLMIDPGATLAIFSGVRTTSIDNTTQFLLSISSLSPDLYRFTYNAGTLPVFRTDRGLTLNGQTLTLLVNANQTLQVTASTTGAFASVVIGDTIFIPGVSTGDVSGPFNPLNEGEWQAIGLDSTHTILQLVRPPGSAFSAYGEADVLTANSQFQAFSAAGIQIGDSVAISMGWALPVLRTFVVEDVNPKWIQVTSTLPLPVAQLGTPTAAGMIFYSNAKRFLKVEADQECVLQQNGDTSNLCRLSPWQAGDPNNIAEYTKVGPTWSLSVVNMSNTVANVLIITVE